MSKSNLGRRQFLAGLGAMGLLPFVPILNASGDESTAPKRLVLFYTPHGTIRDKWLPTGTQSQFSLPEILAPLAPLQNKIAVVDGLKVVEKGIGAPHTKGMPLLWTASPLLEDPDFPRYNENGEIIFYFGWNSAPSVDQVIASHLQQQPDPCPYRSLEFGIQCKASHPGTRMIYRDAKVPLQPMEDPYQALSQLFGAGTTPFELARIRAERLSILDAMGPRLQLLESKVGQEDRFKIQSHLTAVEEIEATLQSPLTCQEPAVPPGLNQSNTADIPAITKAHLDIMVQSLKCGMTQVCSMQFSRGENDGIRYDWLGIEDDVHHPLTHDTTPETQAKLTKIYTWYASQVAYFISELDKIPEGDGTMLDNTLVVWGSELSRAWDHKFDNMPFVLAGGGGGAIPMGQFYQFPDVEHNRLLVSVCKAMGMDETEQFGFEDDGTGGLFS